MKPGFLQNCLQAELTHLQCLKRAEPVPGDINEGFLNYPATHCHETHRNVTSLPPQPLGGNWPGSRDTDVSGRCTCTQNLLSAGSVPNWTENKPRSGSGCSGTVLGRFLCLIQLVRLFVVAAPSPSALSTSRRHRGLECPRDGRSVPPASSSR